MLPWFFGGPHVQMVLEHLSQQIAPIGLELVLQLVMRQSLGIL
jgi:hypothetical protein